MTKDPIEDVTTGRTGSDIRRYEVRARLGLAIGVLGIAAALLIAAAVLRVLPYPDPKCDSGGDNCAANAAEYAIEARETIWDFATTFFPATITFVLGYWFTRERDA
ncbi:MAG: hypothetical protein F4Y86_15555 [Gammaproteobacteria bacterium]|nr:hypothetical protein [Gammaproteobacteria bacterium]MYB37844.1 hypothetical protein [Gammaproteobacteria bacterium]